MAPSPLGRIRISKAALILFFLSWNAFAAPSQLTTPAEEVVPNSVLYRNMKSMEHVVCSPAFKAVLFKTLTLDKSQATKGVNEFGASMDALQKTLTDHLAEAASLNAELEALSLDPILNNFKQARLLVRSDVGASILASEPIQVGELQNISGCPSPTSQSARVLVSLLDPKTTQSKSMTFGMPPQWTTREVLSLDPERWSAYQQKVNDLKARLEKVKELSFSEEHSLGLMKQQVMLLNTALATRNGATPELVILRVNEQSLVVDKRDQSLWLQDQTDSAIELCKKEKRATGAPQQAFLTLSPNAGDLSSAEARGRAVNQFQVKMETTKKILLENPLSTELKAQILEKLKDKIRKDQTKSSTKEVSKETDLLMQAYFDSPEMIASQNQQDFDSLMGAQSLSDLEKLKNFRIFFNVENVGGVIQMRPLLRLNGNPESQSQEDILLDSTPWFSIHKSFLPKKSHVRELGDPRPQEALFNPQVIFFDVP